MTNIECYQVNFIKERKYLEVHVSMFETLLQDLQIYFKMLWFNIL